MPPKRPSEDGNGDTESSTRFKPIYLDNITILVGDEEVPFTVHKDLICQRSGFFAAACSNKWAEGKEGIVRLPTMTPDTVKLYIHWIYTGQISLDIINVPTIARPKVIAAGCTFKLCKLYVAADMFLDTRAKNAVMDRLLDRCANRTYLSTTQSVNWVFESTSPESLLRKLILDRRAHNPYPEGLRQSNGLSNEFLLSLAVRFAEQLEQGKTAHDLNDQCAYHEHDEKTPACT